MVDDRRRKWSGNIEISLGYRRRGRVSSSLRSHKNRYPEIQTINVPSTIRRLDNSRTYIIDDKVAISLIRREVATKIGSGKLSPKKFDRQKVEDTKIPLGRPSQK